MDRLDAGAVHLGHVGRVDQRQGGDPEEALVGPWVDQPEPGDAETEEVDDQDAGDRPEDVGIGVRHDPERQEDRSGQSPHDGQDEPEREDEDLGDHEQLDVHDEGVQEAREGLPEDLGVEERCLDLRPAGGVDDDPADEPEDDDRADDRDRARAHRARVRTAAAAYERFGSSLRVPSAGPGAPTA